MCASIITICKYIILIHCQPTSAFNRTSWRILFDAHLSAINNALVSHDELYIICRCCTFSVYMMGCALHTPPIIITFMTPAYAAAGVCLLVCRLIKEHDLLSFTPLTAWNK